MLITWLGQLKLTFGSQAQVAHGTAGRWMAGQRASTATLRDLIEFFFKLKWNAYYEGEPRLMLISPFHHSLHLSHNSPVWF